MTLNSSVFKVTPLLDTEYLRNGTRYRRYNEIPIGIYTRPTQRCHFEWPWLILSELAKYSIHEASSGLSVTAELLVFIWVWLEYYSPYAVQHVIVIMILLLPSFSKLRFPSVCLSVCRWRAWAVRRRTTFCRIYLYHLVRHRSGSVVKNSAKVLATVLLRGCYVAEVWKIAVFDQYLA